MKLFLLIGFLVLIVKVQATCVTNCYTNCNGGPNSKCPSGYFDCVASCNPSTGVSENTGLYPTVSEVFQVQPILLPVDVITTLQHYAGETNSAFIQAFDNGTI